MKQFLNKESEKNNIVVITAKLLLIGSCKKDQFNDIESELAKGEQLITVLTKEQIKPILLDTIQKLTSRNTDNDIEIEFLENNKEKELTLEFENTEQKSRCLEALNESFPSHLNQKVNQQGIIASITPSIASLSLAAFAIFLFYEKLPKTTYVIGGLWALVSLFSLYKRFTKPPVITHWTVDKSSLSKGFDYMTQAYTWVFIIAVLVGVSKVLPLDSGPAVIYDHAVKETLYEGNITQLLKKQADINYKDAKGKTALHHLVDQASYRAYEISDSMLAAVFQKATTGKHHLNKKKLKNTPERTAIALIRAGADVNTKDNSGKSLLQYTIENYSDDALSLALFETMLEKGAKLDFVMTEERITPVQFAKEYTEEKIFDKKHLADLLAKYQQ